MKIGIVDLDTSHPAAWVPILRAQGHTLAGVFDHGDVHPHGYAGQFIATHDIPCVFASLAEMAATVDCAIIHSCDWDRHLERAQPFVEAGKAVFIDKPLAGNVADLRRMQGWVDGGARMAGGSALRYCAEVRQWLAQDVAERGQPHTVVSACGIDEFGYGIHAYALLCGIMGPGIASVRCLPGNAQWRVEVQWADGRVGIVVVGQTTHWLPFAATIITERGIHHLQPDSEKLYAALLDACLPYLASEDVSPIQLPAWSEPELAAIAANASRQQDGRPVTLAELSIDTPCYDGHAYVQAYRQKRYGL